MKNKKLLYLVIFILFIWLVALTVLFVEEKDIDQNNDINSYTVSGYSTDLSKVVEKNISSIVSIEQDGNVSTGFIYVKNRKEAYVISSFHGVSNGDTVDVYLHNGDKIKGTIKASDPFVDLALIEIDNKYEFKSVVFGDSKLLKSGEFVLAIGTNETLDYDFSSAFGMISSKYREVENSIIYNGKKCDYNLSVVQINGDFTNGYSGSPVFNMNGEVVGIITMKDGSNITLAISANEAKLIIDRMINDEEYNRFDFGFGGVFIKELENYEAVNLDIPVDVVSGYYVSRLRQNSMALTLGISKGDIITHINDIEINDLDTLLNCIYSGNKTYNFTIIRNNEKLNLTGYVND